MMVYVSTVFALVSAVATDVTKSATHH